MNQMETKVFPKYLEGSPLFIDFQASRRGDPPEAGTACLKAQEKTVHSSGVVQGTFAWSCVAKLDTLMQGGRFHVKRTPEKRDTLKSTN